MLGVTGQEKRRRQGEVTEDVSENQGRHCRCLFSGKLTPIISDKTIFHLCVSGTPNCRENSTTITIFYITVLSYKNTSIILV